MSRLQLTPVAQGLSDFEAKVVTARLGADGILWELRGVVDSLYPLGGIDVLVPVDELEAARVCLHDELDELEARADAHVHPDDVGPRDRAEPVRAVGARRWWVTAAVVVGLVAFSATRVIAAIASFQEPGPEECSGTAQAAAEGLTVRCRR